MRRRWGILGGLACLFAALGGDGPAGTPGASSADFKVEVAEFGLGPKPVVTSEIVARDGRAYQFTPGNDEVVIIDPKRSRVELVDVGRRLQAIIPFAELNQSRSELKAAIAKTVDKRVEKGGRSNLVLAEITRNLIDPRFRVEGDPKGGHLRLLNPNVEIDASGEPDSDPDRLALVALCLDSIANLGAFRVPTDLPPFPELAAIATLAGENHLRPTELNYLYRLAGPPKRFRRTYHLVPSLTDREREAIDRVDRLRIEAILVPYRRYARVERPK